jgi:membrane-bound inhibitor of C-type lysozyme
MACVAALSGCGDNPVVRFPTASTPAAATPTGAVPAQPLAPLGQAPAGDTYSYACNEGIPLVVVVEPGSGGSRVRYSHGSFPFQPMTQTPAGSGALYTDGTNQLHLSGNQALLSYAGTGQVWDSCIRI